MIANAIWKLPAYVPMSHTPQLVTQIRCDVPPERLSLSIEAWHRIQGDAEQGESKEPDPSSLQNQLIPKIKGAVPQLPKIKKRTMI